MPNFESSSDETPRGTHVLVVDDDRDSRNSLSRLLARAGVSVVSAATASEALDACKDRRFDAAVVDIVLPDLHGADLLGKLRELHGPERKLPAVAITGYGSAENRARVEAAGFDEFFVKPPDFGRLLGAISRLAGRA